MRCRLRSKDSLALLLSSSLNGNLSFHALYYNQSTLLPALQMMMVLTDFLTVNCFSEREGERESSSCFREREREGKGAEEVCVGVRGKEFGSL